MKENDKKDINTSEQNENALLKENTTTKSSPQTNNKYGRHTNLFLLICIVGVSLGILLEVINAQNRHKYDCTYDSKPKYWVYSAYKDVENPNGILKHVHLVLQRIGYEKSSNQTPWSLLWSHDYPFKVLFRNLHRLKPGQKVNHFPGTGFITNKVDFAISDSKYIPKAFKIPENKEAFIKYAEEHKNALFMEKDNQHRGIYIKNVSEIDLSSGKSFVQEYLQNPFLVDGYKFDIGVYVVLTSVNPLRAYWYKGDVLFRYCMEKYYPFDPKNLDKYVVGDDYLPTWKVPSLSHPYTELGFGMKDVFDIYIKSKGHDSSKMWADVQKAITEVFLTKEKHIIEALKNYPSQDNFFEMMRFDLMVDQNLKVYILEANMSPNLSSAHYPPNQLLYEQVLYNLFSLVGVADHMKLYNTSNTSKGEQQALKNMISSQKNIAVWGKECNTVCLNSCDAAPLCGLCRTCLNPKLMSSLHSAHREYLHRGDFRRLFPPTMMQNKLNQDDLKGLSESNMLQYLWYQGKCNKDATWCS